jgi:nitrate/TMAO reductase-like tetraheme cytochrome c subunit
VKGLDAANHLPTTASPACETCHSISNFTTFSGTTMKHTLITSGCATCHSGTKLYQGLTTLPVYKQSSHFTTALTCETCHSITNFTTFSGTAMNHTGILSGCASCHSGTTTYQGNLKPVFKNTTTPIHVATSLTCETCHSITNFTTFSGTAMNHTGITTGCVTCHDGSTTYQNNTKPVSKTDYPTHIVYSGNLTGGSTMACEFCHSTTSFANFTALKSSTVIHNGTQGNGSGWCKNCHATGVTANLGVQGKKSVTHQSSTATDCSQSGCHKPLGGEGSTYTSW